MPKSVVKTAMGLAAVEIGVDEFLQLFGLVLDVAAQGGVVEVAQLALCDEPIHDDCFYRQH